MQPISYGKSCFFFSLFPRGYWFARVSAQKQQTSMFRLRPCWWKVFFVPKLDLEIFRRRGRHIITGFFFQVFQKAMTNQHFWNVIVIAYISKMGMKGAFMVGYMTLFKLNKNIKSFLINCTNLWICCYYHFSTHKPLKIIF